MFQLALMLQRVNIEVSTSGDYLEGEQLSRDLLRIRLSPADQAQIVAHLLRLISRYADSRASALWALGEVSARCRFIPGHGCAFGSTATSSTTRQRFKRVGRCRSGWTGTNYNTSMVDELLGDNGPVPWLIALVSLQRPSSR